MVALLVFVVIVTLVLIFIRYDKNKNKKKFAFSLLTLSGLVAFALLGNMTRTIMPLFITHLLFVVLAWGALIRYILHKKYYWWIIFSPVVTIILFFVIDMLIGSREYWG